MSEVNQEPSSTATAGTGNQDGFFAQRPVQPPEKKSVISGCFWAMIIGIGVLMLLITGAVLILVLSGVSAMKGAVGELNLDNADVKPPRYQEAYVMGNAHSGNKIAVVNVHGVITSSEDGGLMSSRLASSPSIVARLRYILKEDSIKAVIIHIDSPGGEVTASDEIYHMVMRIRQERHIPVIASMGSLAASGGYYVAVGCDYIVANRMTATGSIGVIMQAFKYYDLFQKIGVQGEVYKSGKMKDMLSGDRPTTPEEKAVVQNLIMRVYGDFVGVVAKGRSKLTADKIRHTEVGDGRVFLGVQALELGLIDQLGYFEDAVNQAAKMAKMGGDDYRVVTLNPPFSLSMLFSSMDSKFGGRNVSVQLPGSHPDFKLEKGRVYLLPPEFAE